MNNRKENLKFINRIIVWSCITKWRRRIGANRVNDKCCQNLTKQIALQWNESLESTLESNFWIPLLKIKNRKHSKKAVEWENDFNCSWQASASRLSVIMSLSTKVQIWRMELRCFCLSRCVKQLFNCMFRSIRTDSRHSKNIQSIIPCNCAVSHTSFISVSIPNNDSNHKQFMNNETRTNPRWIYTVIVPISQINMNPNTNSFLYLILFFTIWV